MSTEIESRQSIGVVTRETGLAAEVVRVWEKRYGAVAPSRTSGGHRLYSEADISRLKLLRKATQSGYRIGNVVQLSMNQLNELVNFDVERIDGCAAPAPTIPAVGPVAAGPLDRLSACMEAVRNLDEFALQRHLELALVELGQLRFLEKMVGPLMVHIGNDWEHAEIRPFHEHMASVVVRSILYSQRINKVRSGSAPTIVVTTPPGQRHELGALVAAITAESVGWHVMYLGPDLPIEEIAMGARQIGARAVALSVTVIGARAIIARDFLKLTRLLGDDVALIVGGQSVVAFSDAIAEAGATKAESLSAFRAALRDLLAGEATSESDD